MNKIPTVAQCFTYFHLYKLKRLIRAFSSANRIYRTLMHILTSKSRLGQGFDQIRLLFLTFFCMLDNRNH